MHFLLGVFFEDKFVRTGKFPFSLSYAPAYPKMHLISEGKEYKHVWLLISSAPAFVCIACYTTPHCGVKYGCRLLSGGHHLLPARPSHLLNSQALIKCTLQHKHRNPASPSESTLAFLFYLPLFTPGSRVGTPSQLTSCAHGLICVLRRKQ